MRARKPSAPPDLGQMVRQGFAPSPPRRLGVAVSGGGDSVALLHLLADWARDGGPGLTVATVDHGLRPEATDEARAVAQSCDALGLSHATLRWQGWDGRGNLSDAARRARYGLLSDWAHAQGIATVALGHTADDQAETFLMRLARGSGVDGLSAMASRRDEGGIAWVRPLLAARRGDLRNWLRARGIPWFEDPTNEDTQYDRVRAREALRALGPLGLSVETLTETAARMAAARMVLEAAARALAGAAATVEAGTVVIARAPFDAAAEDTRLRLFAAALAWVGGESYRPRLAGLTAALARAGDSVRTTLAGCLILPCRDNIRIVREPAAAGPDVAFGMLWDRRWKVEGPAVAGARVGALGPAGLAACPDWRLTGLPRAALLATPAVRLGDRLIAAPLAGQGGAYRAFLAGGRADFIPQLIVH